MSKETSVTLRAVLMMIETSETKAEILAKVKAMCDKEDIDSVMVQLEELRRQKQGA